MLNERCQRTDCKLEKNKFWCFMFSVFNDFNDPIEDCMVKIKHSTPATHIVQTLDTVCQHHVLDKNQTMHTNNILNTINRLLTTTLIVQ